MVCKKEATAVITSMRKARSMSRPDGGLVTCAASRHAALMAEELLRGRKYPMLDEEPDYIAASVGYAVASLWETRAALAAAKAEIAALNDEVGRLKRQLCEYADGAEMLPDPLDVKNAEIAALKDALRRAANSMNIDEARAIADKLLVSEAIACSRCGMAHPQGACLPDAGGQP